MIEVLKKRFSVGDEITIRTVNTSFTGVIDSFDNNCIILISHEGNIEFIANDVIKGASAPNKDGLSKKESEIPPKPIKENNEAALNLPKEDSKEEILDYHEKDSQEINSTGNKTGEIVIKKLGSISNKPKNPKIKGRPEFQGNSLSDLSQLILPEIEAENKKIVPANGVIIKYFGNRGFGYLRDKFKNEIWFSFSDIIETWLRDNLIGSSTKANIPVLFTLSTNYKGKKAVLVHYPKTIGDLIETSKEYLKDQRSDIALGLVEQILESYPDNFDAQKIKKEIEANQLRLKKPTARMTRLNPPEKYYPTARRYNTEKRYEESLKYYMLALENNERRETCIKDIASLYVSIGEPQKALEFITKHEDELSKNITTYNYLENLFYATKDFEKFLKYVELLLKEESVTRDSYKYSRYLARKGFALIQLNKLDQARTILERAIRVIKDYPYAISLLKALDEPNEEEFDKLVKEAEQELGFLGSEISSFLKERLSLCEFEGLKSSAKSKIIESGEFKKHYLDEIRETLRLRELLAGKSKERANYLLTEARLMDELEPDRRNEYRSVLARYCNAMASNAIAEMYEGSLDVARYFYIEAFNIEDQWDSLRVQTAMFINSLKWSNRDLITNSNSPTVENSLSLFFQGDVTEFHWNSLVSLFVSNRTITAQLIRRIFDVQVYRELSVRFLNSLTISLPRADFNLNEFAEAWNKAREKRNKEFRNWLTSIKAISANERIETLTSQLYDSLQDAKKSWLTQLDISRLNAISTDILDALNQYLRQSGYREKERSYGSTKAQVNQLILEIKEKPTKFSYEGFIPLLEKIDVLLDESFKTVEEASTPKVKVSIEGEERKVDTHNIVLFQLRVENSKDSSPIRDIRIVVKDNEDIEFLPNNNEHFDSIEGGGFHIFKLSVRVSDKVIRDKATSLDVLCYYKKRNSDEPVEILTGVALRLFSEDEFQIIPNLYAPIANSSGVSDRRMFYGRNEFIKDITDAILNAESKQVVIYGQKRSGKTAVLDYLKLSLEETGQLFCIKFSIGNIFENISTATFFYKILSLICEELEFLKYDGSEVPEFKLPNYRDFSESLNPADEFRKQIRLFKRQCQMTRGWEGKKLVVMVDEITYLYTAIKQDRVSDSFMKQWKAITQNEEAAFSAVLVGQDVFPAFKEEFENEFGVTQDERLTYLSEFYAKKLIEEPTWNEATNTSRFIGDAVETILEYTSNNPYYIVQFCDRLINEMNNKKFSTVTVADVRDIADSFINGEQALTKDKFDNLLNAGEKHDIQRIPQEHSEAILRQIAHNARHIGFCPREGISLGNQDYEDEILEDLVRREVVEKKDNNYKIKVRLFQEWLLKH